MDHQDIDQRGSGLRLHLNGISLAIFGVIFCMWLSACVAVPVEPLPPSPSATATLTPTLTPTVIWFPPTTTPTVFTPPVISPTLDLTSPAGDLIFTDNFDDATPWTLGQTETTSVALGNQALTLALNQPEGYLFTLRSSPILEDFYLEVIASPSLCRKSDEYGLLLRASSSGDFYRFSMYCDGHVRLDKYLQGKASSPYPKTLTGVVPPGAPSSSRLGVWVEGREMRFYVNEQYLFVVNDPSLTKGSIGFFIRSAGDNAVTVSFSSLKVYSLP